MRFVAPPRQDVPAACFEHPVFDGYRAHVDLLAGAEWPTRATLNGRMAAVDSRICFAEQDAALLAEREHYELRIARTGRVATRVSNWHDLLNALVWIEHAPLKRALNARQVADITMVGSKQRTRGQCALTHFDEAGVVVHFQDAAPLAAWDRHDWHALFIDHAAAWSDATITVFGHALLEHALLPDKLFVGKALVCVSDGDAASDLASLAAAIERGKVLQDPQELRPLPLAGVPGWHPRAGEAAFIASAPCFRSLRPGRVYPPPLRRG
jgi:hypothetical protein